jgi:hypothetical protein
MFFLSEKNLIEKSKNALSEKSQITMYSHFWAALKKFLFAQDESWTMTTLTPL